MANFTKDRYPWPTVDHGGANAQTGGNTRLLFAEQDNYRTSKGASVTEYVTDYEELAVTTGFYQGQFADDLSASGSPAERMIYWNTTNSDFMVYESGSWGVIARTTSSIQGTEIIDGTYNYVVCTPSATDSTWANFDAIEESVETMGGQFIIPPAVDKAIIYNESDSKAYIVNSVEESDVSGVGDLFYVIPRVVSADIAETTENIPIEFLKGSLSANKAQAGAQTYGNGFSIAASEEGLHLFLRTLCNSRSNDIEVKTRKGSDADGNVDTPRRDVLSDEIQVFSGLDENSFDGETLTNMTDIDGDVVSQIRVKWVANPSSVDDDLILEVQIDGFDHSGEELREIMIFTKDDLDETDHYTDQTTDFYFGKSPTDDDKTTIRVTSNVPTGDAVDTQGTFDVYYQDKWSEVTLSQQDSVLLPGWTVEVRKGTIPFTYVGVSPNEASIALSRDTALQLDITTIAFDSLAYTDITGETVDLDDGSGSEGIDITEDKARGDLGFVDASETLFTGWQAYLDVVEPGTARGIRVPLTDATFSINHQLDQAQLIVGDRRPGPPFRSTLRDVMLDGTILFTRERDWVKLFRNNVDFKNPVVVLRNAPAGGFAYELHIELGLGQLMSSPDPQVSDLGLITQAFNMKFRESASGRSDDFRFKIVTDKWIFSEDNNTLGGLRVDGVYASPSA
jgi:hypothetical protein